MLGPQGPAAALQSYLNVDAVMDAIRRTGAQAVSNPSWGRERPGRQELPRPRPPCPPSQGS